MSTITLKKKICKGIGKTKGFGCDELKYLYHSGLCKKCYLSYLNNTEDGKALLKKWEIKVVGKKKDTWNSLKKPKKAKETDPKITLQININKLATLIDKGKRCLATDVPGLMQAGHVFAVGGSKNMRYNLHNIHRQSCVSNNAHQDKLLQEGVAKEYGPEYLDFITSLKRTPTPSYTRLQYKELSVRAAKAVNMLKEVDKCYTKEDRILLRNSINKDLAIYDDIYLVFNL